MHTQFTQKLIYKILDKNIDIKTVDKSNFPLGVYEPNLNGNKHRIELGHHDKDLWIGENFDDDISVEKISKILSEDQLLILAHEYGHALSFEEGTRTSHYESALRAFNLLEVLSNDQKIAIYKEETLAWEYAKSQLAELNYNNFEYLNKYIDYSLNIYKEILTLSF